MLGTVSKYSDELMYVNSCRKYISLHLSKYKIRRFQKMYLSQINEKTSNSCSL
jgi:hypothetical protein